MDKAAPTIVRQRQHPSHSDSESYRDTVTSLHYLTGTRLAGLENRRRRRRRRENIHCPSRRPAREPAGSSRPGGPVQDTVRAGPGRADSAEV